MKIYLAHADTGPDSANNIHAEMLRAKLTMMGHLVMPQVQEMSMIHPSHLTERPWAGENDGLRLSTDIDLCDLFVALASSYGENYDTVILAMGYALGLAKPVIMMGDVTSTLQCLPQVTRYHNLSELLDALEKLT